MLFPSPAWVGITMAVAMVPSAVRGSVRSLASPSVLSFSVIRFQFPVVAVPASMAVAPVSVTSEVVSSFTTFSTSLHRRCVNMSDTSGAFDERPVTFSAVIRSIAARLL